MNPLDELHARFRMDADHLGWITCRNEDNTRYRNDMVQWCWTFYLYGGNATLAMIGANKAANVTKIMNDLEIHAVEEVTKHVGDLALK